jgi:hypothetical protein
MNRALSDAESDALLEVLYHGFVLIRLAALDAHAARAEAIADALHNVPHLLKQGDKWGWTVAGFGELFLAPLVERYPDLRRLDELLRDERRPH